MIPGHVTEEVFRSLYFVGRPLQFDRISRSIALEGGMLQLLLAYQAFIDVFINNRVVFNEVLFMPDSLFFTISLRMSMVFWYGLLSRTQLVVDIVPSSCFSGDPLGRQFQVRSTVAVSHLSDSLPRPINTFSVAGRTILGLLRQFIHRQISLP